MPFINYILKKIKFAIEEYIIDIPEISDEKKAEIVEKVGSFTKDLIEKAAEGAAKGAAEGLKQ